MSMVNNLKHIIEGTGIGLLGGLLIGITESDWIRLLIAIALFASTGISLKGAILKKDISPGQSFTGIAAFVAVLVGLYFNGQQTFKLSPSDAVSKWEKAGFSPEQARAMYLKNWELEKQQDSEPSPAVQVMIKSIIDRKGSDSIAVKENKDSIRPDATPDSVSTGAKEEFP